MKADGVLLRFKRGVQAREVTAAHSGYRVVRCDSDRTVLWGSAELESHRLYFLVPEERARSRAAFEKFWKVGESKGLVPRRSSSKGSNTEDSDAKSSVMSSMEFRKLAWTPQLRTIPETLSPEMAKADCAAEMKTVQTPCSLSEQLGFGAGARPAAMMVS